MKMAAKAGKMLQHSPATTWTRLELFGSKSQHHRLGKWSLSDSNGASIPDLKETADATDAEADPDAATTDPNATAAIAATADN